MSKITQRELLEEGFLDAVRAAGRSIGRGAVKTAGAVAGAVAGATKNIARDLVKGDTNANLFSSISSGAKQGAKSGASIADKALTAITGKEEAALRKELETNYKNVFQPVSLKIGRGQPDPSNMNITIVPFTARRLSDNTIMALGSTATGGSIQGSNNVSSQPTTGLRGRFMAPLTQYTSDFKGSQQGSFFGYVIKTGNKNDPFNITVRDSYGQIISGNNDKETLPKLDILMRKLNFNTNNSPVNKWSIALKRSFGNKMQDPRKDIDKLIPAAVGNDGYILTPADVALLRQHLKDEMLISEKNTQKDLLLQLKLLNDSYNKTYELSKH